MLRAALWSLILCLGMLSSTYAAGARAADPGVPQPQQFSVYDGLPSNRVNAIAEDAQGYLWIATRDGLARYDGVGFRVWRAEDGLRDNFVWTVHVDARDRVWIGTQQGGVAMLDVQRRTFRHYDRTSHPAMGSNTVWMITSTRDGDLWFGTSDAGLHRLGPDGRIRRYMPQPGNARSLPSAAVSSVKVDRHGALWVGTKAGVARWTGRDFEHLPSSSLPSLHVDSLSFDQAGGLWIGMPGQGYVRRADGRLQPMPWIDPPLGVSALHMLLQDRQGAHWLDTRSGLSREANGIVQNVPLYSNTSRGIVRPAWTSVYEDREGGLWFGSGDSGLWHLPANWRNFTMLPRREGDDSTPANAFVHGVAPATGNGLWLVGSGGVLDWLDPQTGAIEHRLRQVCGDLLGFGVHETADGIVWIGCRGQLVRFDPRGGAVQRWSSDDDTDPALAADISQFVVQRDGTLWLSDGSSVQMRDPAGRVLDTITVDDKRGLPVGEAARQMMRAPDGGVWIAGRAGLLMWNDGERRFEPVPGAPTTAVYGFTIASDDTVWLAGIGTLSAYWWNGAELTHAGSIDARQGLPTVAPGGVVIDGVGTLWMTTVRGLIRYDPQRKRVRVYGVHEGLPSQEFSNSPIQLSPLGYLAVGTADGLLLFHPQQVQWSERMPTLAIESVDVRRGDALAELPHDGKRAIDVRHDDRDLRVVARLLSFTDAHAHRYRFRLDGYDPDWIEPERGGERIFSRLTPGSYRLDVQARTADGDWTPSQQLEFRVTPPWWRTPWALAALVLAIVALLVWVARSYRLRLKRRNSWQLAVQKRELAEQASLAKTRFLATLGHEVRTPMTGVLGMSELLASTGLDAKQRGYVDAIRRAGEHLMRLVNDALDLARIEAGRLELELQAFDLHALVEEVIAMTAPMAKQRGLEFRSRIAADAPRWLLGDPMRVRQILLNLLGNALKFTERGSVSLKVASAAPGVRFVIADTGPGLNDEQKARLFQRFGQAEGARTAARYGGSGLGLAICQELAAAMGGRIALDSTPGQGTDFTVDLPLSDAEPPATAAVEAGVRKHHALHLLLVEDDATVAEVIVGLLQAQGHTVVHAAHGLAALSEVASTRFDLALLDLDLPGLDGLALARQLRGQGIKIPLLAVTARADADAEPLARAAGFDGFLRKPLTGALLAEAIEALLPTRDPDDSAAH